MAGRGATDFLVVGGGIVGACIARSLRAATGGSVRLVDKSPVASLPEHGSARNSGVMHAGFYYSSDSLKAKLTRQGNVFLHAYCEERGIPMNKCGKLVIARTEDEVGQYDMLLQRANVGGVPLERVDAAGVRELEPLAFADFGGLWSPSTAAADPVAVTKSLLQDAVESGVELVGSRAITALRRLPGGGVVAEDSAGGRLTAGHVVNCAGLHADTLAHQLGHGLEYSILPFKGLYMYCRDLPLRRLVYPVPSLVGGAHAPFLGVHFTVTVDGSVKIGPTAIPALWREQYGGLAGFSPQEAGGILATQARLALSSSFGFAALARGEVLKYIPAFMQAGARELVPSATGQNFGSYGRPGIRAQLVHRERGELEMDFVVRGDGDSTHVLNAVSPGWTCAEPFAKLVVAQHILPGMGQTVGGGEIPR